MSTTTSNPKLDTSRDRTRFQQTEIGELPVDWDVKHLGDLGQVVRGGSPRPAGDPRFFNGSFIPWLTVASLTNIPEHQLAVSETVGFLTEEGSKRSRVLHPGTLIIANSGATLGVAKLLQVTCCANDGIAAIIEQRTGDKVFLCHFINTQTERLREVIATGNGQPNLNTALIREIAVPFPHPDEQRAIAAALSDVDELIGALDKLIAKKRAIKLATMQQLLTGKTRLPGFSGEWAPITMGSIGTTYGGLSGKSKADFGHGVARYVTFLNVLENVTVDPDLLEHVDVSPSESQNAVREGDILFNGTSETPGDLAMGCVVSFAQAEVYLNSFCFGFRLHDIDEHVPRFLAYTFRADVGRSLMFALAQGATRYNMSKKQFLSLELILPEADEQRAIVKVLSDMDAEIAALEQRRDKTKAIKQGMMQSLLTGRVRLVEPEGTP